MALASPQMVAQYLYGTGNELDINLWILKCRSQVTGIWKITL
jgi:hypothetical protein